MQPNRIDALQLLVSKLHLLAVQHPTPVPKRRLSQRLGETVGMLRVRPNKGQANCAMIYQVPKVMDGIAKVLGSTGHTHVLSDLDRCLVVYCCIPGPNVVPRCCALMPGLTWSLLTSPVRVLAGQTGDALQVPDRTEATERGGVPEARACGSVPVVGHPDMCANGPDVNMLRPGSRAQPLHPAMCTPWNAPCRAGHVGMRMCA